MGDRLGDMKIFARVARLQSFSEAARELGTSTTSVSRRVGALEDDLGVKLLQRTTRRISMTDAGRGYLDRCEALLAEVALLEDEVREETAAPRGTLRVATGVSFAQEQLNPVLPRFLARYPDLSVELDLADRPVDLVAEGIDVAVRIGRLPDSSLVARRLALSRLALVASEEYLTRRGAPKAVEDLREHECILDRNQPLAWRLRSGGEETDFVPRGRLRVNSAHTVLAAAAGGHGIGLVPTFVSGPALSRGDVRCVLPEVEPVPVPLNAVYPPNRHLATRVRVFLDFLREEFGDPPSWDAWRSEADTP